MGKIDIQLLKKIFAEHFKRLQEKARQKEDLQYKVNTYLPTYLLHGAGYYFKSW